MFSDRRKRDMANHGEGNKYASGNLNKSYGYHQYNNQSGGYGANRGRGGGGGGGSMVVLSRPRSSQNAGPKLSVPPPLNLPSLRKEHERVDSSGSSFHSGGGISGSGTRPASSGMGWSKPAVLQDADIANHSVEGVTRGNNGLNMPLVSRGGAAEPSERAFRPVEKVATLRGEDFPSLKASLPSASVSGQKQKEGLNQKQKQAAGEELPKELRSVSGMGSSLVDMRPQNQSGHSRVGNELSESPGFSDGLHSSEQMRKKEYLPGPLPLVRLTPRSDWADDERDTSHGLRDRDRDIGYSKNEPFWDRGFDLPRSHVLPQKHSAPNHFDKPGQRENEISKSSMTQARPVSGGRREANAWRVSAPLQNEAANYNKNIYGARPSSRDRELKKSNYVLSASRENVWNNPGGREGPYQHGGRQPWNSNMDSSSNRGNFTRDGYGAEYQNRDKRPFFKSDKPHVEDPYMKDFGDSGFDVHDPFPVLGVVKKKKEALKQTEFHDPVRESFEAELERVQKMQEEERRRIVEEQERMIELARTEEEERVRVARERDEQQKRLEEEAREAAFRNEQERLEAARRVEELRKSKEEEKHRLLIEEERRKQAAKQKLLELEEKISRRQAEAARGCSTSSTVSDEKFLDIGKEKELSKAADVVDWEDSDRMVDRITMSSPLDLSVPSRSFESDVVSQISRDGSFGFPDRQKPTWRKEDIESGSNSRFITQNMESVPHNSQRDVSGGFPKEEFFGTTGYLNATSYFKPGFPEHSVDQSWRTPGDGRTYGRNHGMESESRESFGEQYGEGWGQNQDHARLGPYSPYPEKLYQNSEGDDYYPFGRPRYSVRQPRVLPPPQASRQKSSFGSEVEHPVPSTSIGEMKYSHTGRTNSTVLASYTGDLQDHRILPGSGLDENRFDSKLTGRCDSQSSLSVTSPPDSPVHLSHDDLDESADSSLIATSRKGEDTNLLEKGGAPVISSDAGKDSLTIATGSVSCWENEEWTLDSNERLQEQEEYDEDEDGYQEEDKVHGVDENIDLAQDLEELHLQDKDSNLVLGFNEGVEVEIPSDDFEKRQQNSKAAASLSQHTVSSVDGERPSIEASRGEQAAQPVENSDPVSMHNASRSFQDTKSTMQNLKNQPNSGRQSFELANKVDSTSYSAISTHPVVPPHSIGLHSSPRQTAIPPASSTSQQKEEPVKFQFGLFSGPSLIPSPFPAIQIGSIQMPLPLHPQYGSSLTHIQNPQSPIIQFGQLRYASPLSQGVLPPPPHSAVQANSLSTYAINQNPGSLTTVQLGQGNSANLIARNAATSVANPQLSVLRRPSDVSDGGTVKNTDTSPARVNSEAGVSPQRQGELSRKSEFPSRKMSHGKSNLSERQSGGQVQIDTTAARNSGFRSSGTAEVSRVDSSGYRRYRRQRVEFRVRESNGPSSEEYRNANGRAHNSTRIGGRKYVVSNRSLKQASDSSVSGLSATQKTSIGDSSESRPGKDAVEKNPLIPHAGQANLKRNMISEKEIDAPLQSGIVRVFEQHGIEAPSDDDDFIEVRSKRQMLNDRREQREKEIKEKSQASKASRKPHSTLQNSKAVARSNPPAGRVAYNKQFNPVSNRQTLAPIGTPSPKPDSHSDEKSGSNNRFTQASTALPVISRNDQNPGPSFVFSNKNKVVDNVQTSVGTWGNQLSDQPVMALTQSQLDEAMKPVSLLHSCVSNENGASRISKPNPTSTTVVPKSNTFTSCTSPIKSLLAEGKIQFGAVTSSTVIPPCGGRTENDSSLYFEKTTKHRNPSPSGLEMCEAEAEAAASAIAVAAITNDETGGSALGTGSVLPVEAKIYGGADLDDGAASAGAGGGQPSLSKAEESLIVSLPADLSVETPISLWPPLPSPHSSNQMITHFPPGPPHFPFYDVNPMLRGPIFAFGPHNDSGQNQSQSQKGPGTVSGPPTTWQQQVNSGVDSFYAPPAGFTGPFLTPPGGIPGVQGPPHMFVYNHFAPVGQFGGLSFMGTTYIPSGKQPDWKHNPIVSSSTVGGDGDVNNPNVASLQCNIVPGSLQHLPMPSPLAMFDPSPFQSSSQEMPVRARWPYMPFPGPPVQMQKQQEAADGSNLPSPQFNNSMMHPAPNRYPNIQTSAVADAMVDSSNSYSSTTSASPPKPTTTLSDPNSNNTQNSTGPGYKAPQPSQHQQQSSQEKSTPSQHVGGSSHHHQHQHQHNRRSGFHGRNQPMARERGFQNNTKVKQIYVAKQTSNSNGSVSTTTTSPSI